MSGLAVAPPQSSNPGQEEAFALLHSAIISAITVVGGYVQFQFQSGKLPPFAQYGHIVGAAFVMLCLYVTGLMAELKLHNRSKYLAIVKQFTPLFGLLVVVLLLFILSPFLGLAASIIWVFWLVGPTIRLFQQIIQWIRGIILRMCTNQTATSNDNPEETDSTGTQENGSLA